MGVGLYLHNLLHNKDYNQSSAALPDGKKVNYTCNCIDDFTMPFTETSIVELLVVNSSDFEYTSFYKESIPFSFHFFNSLRAPPFVIA